MVTSAISAISNLAPGKKLTIHLIYRNIPKETLETLKQFFDEKFATQFKFYETPNNLAEIFHNESCPEKHISNAMFDRLFIHKLIPEINKAIYLDADIIVEKDLSKLYETNLKNNIIGAVIEPAFEYDVKKYGYNAIRLMKLDIDTHYFNSGVLLLDLAKLRKTNFIDKCSKYFNKHIKNIIWPDQDVLNGVLGHKTHFLSPEFNSEVYENNIMANEYQNYFDFYGKSLPYSEQDIQIATYAPTILHFVGPNKPWIHPGKYYIHKEKYWKYYNMSPWKNKDSMLVEKKLINTSLQLNHQKITDKPILFQKTFDNYKLKL
jgi:lipopolysaccharide biosynthesis glycosyltransferase